MMKHMNKNKLFKIFVVLLLIVSLGCNGFLMYKVLGGNQSSGSSNSNATVQKVNYDVQSDLTEVENIYSRCGSISKQSIGW